MRNIKRQAFCMILIVAELKLRKEMEIEKDPFLAPLRDSLEGEQGNDVNKVLYNFQHKVTKNCFSKYSEKEILDIFQIIWKLLLTTAASPSSMTRLAAYRATGAFLTRVTPYYPELIHKSFSHMTLLTTIDVKSSAVIASSFAFISTYIAEPLLPTFLKSTPVFHHFAANDTGFSEHLAVIISKLGHLGDEWMKNLLQYFLDKVSENQNRYLIRAIAAIIGHNPRVYIQIVLDYIKEDIQKYLSLITFLISSHQKDIETSVDLMPVALAAIDLISSDNASISDFDSALQILSIKSNSFKFQADSDIKDLNDGELDSKTCKFKVWNNSEEKEVSVNISNLLTIPSFYSLNLPINLLKPKEDDSALVLCSKFKSLGSIEEFDINEVFDIFEPYLLNSYNEVTSAAIQGIALCINKIIKFIPQGKLYPTIRNILFAKQQSWYHSLDILRVIKNIDPKLFVQKLGENLFIELVRGLVGYCFCENESLSNDSIAALVDLTNASNYDKITRAVIDLGDFFDIMKLNRTINALICILKKINQKNEFLDLFTQMLIEIIPLSYDCMSIVCEGMNFLSLYIEHITNDLVKSKLAIVLNMAYCIAYSTIELVTGQPIKIPNPTKGNSLAILNTKFYPIMKGIVENDVNSRNVDIITEPNKDYKEFVYPLKCSLLFIMGYAPKEESINLAGLTHELLPYECSIFYEHNWRIISNYQRFEILSNINRFLNYVSDERIHATWCRISFLTNNFFTDLAYKDVWQFLHRMAEFYLSKANENNPLIAASYIHFLYEEDKASAEKLVKEYIEKVDKKFLRNVLNENPSIQEFISIPNIDVTNDLEHETENQTDMIQNVAEEDKEINYEILSEEQIQIILEKMIQHTDINEVEKILEVAIKRNIKLNIDINRNEFSPSIIPIIAKYKIQQLDSMSDEEIKSMSLLALRKAQTKWREFSIAVIKRNPSYILDHFKNNITKTESDQKIKKNDIICLCSLINEVKFDEQLLIDIASNLVFQSEKTSRFSVTLKLLSTAIVASSTPPPASILTGITKNIGTKMDLIDTEQMSLTLLLLAQRLAFDNDIIAFTKKLLILCWPKTAAHARVYQLLIGISSNLKYVGANFYNDLPDVIVLFLKSSLPSRFCNGARLYQQTVLSVPSNYVAQFLIRALEIIVNKFHNYSYYPSVNNATFQAIMSFLDKDKIAYQQNEFFKMLPQKMATKTFLAAFNTSIGFYPSVLRIISRDNDNFQRIYTYCESLFEVSNSFNAASRCLEEYIQKLKSKTPGPQKLLGFKSNFGKQMQPPPTQVHPSDVIKTSLVKWSGAISNISYKTSQQVDGWRKLMLKYMKPSDVFATLCVQLIKILPFWIVFPTILRVYVENKDDKEINNLVDAIYDIPTANCHKVALKAMQKSTDYKNIIKLSLYDQDCPESDELIKTFSTAIA